MSAATAFDVKHKSRALTEGPERAAARAYLHGIGYSHEDLEKPIVGVAIARPAITQAAETLPRRNFVLVFIEKLRS